MTLHEIYGHFMDYQVDDLQHLPEVSRYNTNYYMDVLTGTLLFGLSDDDRTTEWYVVRGNAGVFCIGISDLDPFSDKPEVIWTDECYRG